MSHMCNEDTEGNNMFAKTHQHTHNNSDGNCKVVFAKRLHYYPQFFMTQVSLKECFFCVAICSPCSSVFCDQLNTLLLVPVV